MRVGKERVRLQGGMCVRYMYTIWVSWGWGGGGGEGRGTNPTRYRCRCRHAWGRGHAWLRGWRCLVARVIACLGRASARPGRVHACEVGRTSGKAVDGRTLQTCMGMHDVEPKRTLPHHPPCVLRALAYSQTCMPWLGPRRPPPPPRARFPRSNPSPTLQLHGRPTGTRPHTDICP